MGVSASDYRTSKFTLKDQDAVDHIHRLVDLLKDEENHYGGYYFDDHFIDIYRTGDEFTFRIITGGYADSSPELRRSAVYEGEDDCDDEPVDLFSEIQSNLKEGTYFTSMCCENDKSGMYFYMYLHHADGRNEYMNSSDVEKELLKKMGLENSER